VEPIQVEPLTGVLSKGRLLALGPTL